MQSRGRKQRASFIVEPRTRATLAKSAALLGTMGQGCGRSYWTQV